jgi:predicted cupin superfamily sugar epimerase
MGNDMNERARDLIQSLGLIRHPEGGYFREVYRSPREVTAVQDGRRRSALTTIHYLLPEGDHSRWHVLGSDELWHHLEGDPLELFLVEPERLSLQRILLGPADEGETRVQDVPAGHWQAARSTGAYTLVGCTMGPGFDPADHRFLGDDPEAAGRFRREHPDLTGMI